MTGGCAEIATVGLWRSQKLMKCGAYDWPQQLLIQNSLEIGFQVFRLWFSPARVTSDRLKMNSSGQLVLFRKGHGQQDQLTESNCHSQSEAHFRRTEVNLPCSEKFPALFFIENCLVPRISTISGLSTPLVFARTKHFFAWPEVPQLTFNYYFWFYPHFVSWKKCSEKKCIWISRIADSVDMPAKAPPSAFSAGLQSPCVRKW